MKIELTKNEYEKLMDVLRETYDEGPPREGWKSDELEQLIEKLETVK